MADHTHLPWEAGETGHGSPYAVYSDDATGSIIAMCQHTYVNRSHEQMIANVAFIVKAVNNHDALVKSLHEATTRLADVVDDTGYQLDGDFIAPQDKLLTRLRAALQEAGR